ncbi:sigma factor-like helix-turn-helix DNA-binding protein [Nocardioides sp. InS609-2]|uniref:RNA polymerase sigma factor n=1 Tax=Nocardioides sp. InS609-2 TaxID=2760705 RepID=UPI0020C18583|nr:sigma factor-like helix-turn-helix DNA-binding protein [Nocardioides sp. InS609-2]
MFIDSRRRRSAHEKPTDTLPDRGVDDSPVVRLALAEALAGLDELDRVVLVRRYLDDAPVAVVANELGISEGAVRNRSLRALDRLRARFGADLSDLRAP